MATLFKGIQTDIYGNAHDVLLPAPSAPTGGTGTVTEEFTAGEVIPAPRVVMLDAGKAYLFDPSTETNYFKIAGVSVTAALNGAQFMAITEGLLSSPGSFVADATYFAGASGVLTTTTPTSGLSVKIGYAKSIDVLMVDISLPVVLA